MNKKVFDIIYTGFSLFLLFAFGIAVAKAQERQAQSQKTIFIPEIHSGMGYTITGRVVSPQNIPLPGITIRTNKDQVAVTDQNGDYSITGLANGTYRITPSLGMTTFFPASYSVVTPADGDKINFIARVQCTHAILKAGPGSMKPIYINDISMLVCP